MFDRNAPLPGETALREAIPIFINSFEQLTYVRDTVDWFFAQGFRNVTVIDQGSIYEPLVAYYSSGDFRQKSRLKTARKNIGPRRAVKQAAVMAGVGRPFIFTDPDLGLPSPPADDFLLRLFQLGAKYGVTKVGLALDVSDASRVRLSFRLNKHDTIESYNQRFFRDELEGDVWRARVDTTFFLHLPDPSIEGFGIMTNQPGIPAIRVGGPGFVSDHRPWLFDMGMPIEELEHYQARCSAASTFFKRSRV
jgi:hypothetical protein